jgi:hypothetical protein
MPGMLFIDPFLRQEAGTRDIHASNTAASFLTGSPSEVHEEYLERINLLRKSYGHRSDPTSDRALSECFGIEMKETWEALARISTSKFTRREEDDDTRTRGVFSFTKPTVNTHKVHGWRSISFSSGTVFFILPFHRHRQTLFQSEKYPTGIQSSHWEEKSSLIVQPCTLEVA